MSDCFVLYLLLTCMKKKTSGADKFTNNTTPEVEISGIADAKAYKDAVQPMIRVKDDNLDTDQVHVQLVGANCGEVKLDVHCVIVKSKSEQTIHLSDFAQEKIADALKISRHTVYSKIKKRKSTL